MSKKFARPLFFIIAAVAIAGYSAHDRLALVTATITAKEAVTTHEAQRAPAALSTPVLAEPEKSETKLEVTRPSPSGEESSPLFPMGKAEFNLSYVMEKSPEFNRENPRLAALLQNGKAILPGDVQIPEGFRVSLRLEPSCALPEGTIFQLEPLDPSALALLHEGLPAFVAARTKDRLNGEELAAALKKEACVTSAGADLKEEAGAVSVGSEPATRNPQATAALILKNAGLLDLFANIDYSTFKSSSVTFGVVDTGVNISHPDLAGIATGERDDYGHGTMVAGTAAAPANGIGSLGSMPFHVKVRSYKINEAGQGMGYSSTINNGILRAAFEKMDVINVSWSGFTKGSYNSSIDTAVKQGSLVVGSAGNYTANVTTNVTIPGSIAVGALSGTNNSIASYSNYGKGVEIFTPGTFMTTLRNGGYGLASGTSFASPLVGGIALMIKAYGRARGYEISPAMLETIILRTGQYISSSRGVLLKLQPLNAINWMRRAYL